jgi:hypothetical protein
MNQSEILNLILIIICIILVCHFWTRSNQHIVKSENFSGVTDFYGGGSGYTGRFSPEYRDYRSQADADSFIEGMEEVAAIKGAPQAMNYPSNFFLQKNRFLKENGKVAKSIGTGSCPYSKNACWRQNDLPGCQWSVPYEAGANGVVGDLLWNYMEPRMIMQDNCMNCGDYKAGKDYNAPTGISSPITAQYDGTMEGGALSQYDLYSNELDIPSFNGELPHTMSPPMNTGIPDLKHDCVKTNVDDSARCGCGDFGSKIYNFH